MNTTQHNTATGIKDASEQELLVDNTIEVLQLNSIEAVANHMMHHLYNHKDMQDYLVNLYGKYVIYTDKSATFVWGWRKRGKQVYHCIRHGEEYSYKLNSLYVTITPNRIRIFAN